jgi:hypothetical protein
VGALGDKERPATSYVVVACRARDRWFDLDAVRTAPTSVYQPAVIKVNTKTGGYQDSMTGTHGNVVRSSGVVVASNAAGAPPRDWFHTVDAILDAGLDELNKAGNPGKVDLFGVQLDSTEEKWTTRGTHLRRRIERAGILTTLEALDISPRGYSGAHYAVWPPELVRLLVDEMCPRRVCTVCGEPSRRVTRVEYIDTPDRPLRDDDARRYGSIDGKRHNDHRATSHETIGWSDCGHGTWRCRLCNTPHGLLLDYGHPICSICGSDLDYVADHWRPGRILDPFVGSGTTLAVATGMGRDAVGIDIDERNADLARDRVGMFLTVHHPDREATP